MYIWEKIKLVHEIRPYIQINSRIKDLNINWNTIKLLYDNRGEYLHDHDRNKFPKRVTKSTNKIDKIGKFTPLN